MPRIPADRRFNPAHQRRRAPARTIKVETNVGDMTGRSTPSAKPSEDVVPDLTPSEVLVDPELPSSEPDEPEMILDEDDELEEDDEDLYDPESF